MFTISFSWDDGSPFDLKLVALHEKYKIPATLFVPNINKEGRKVLSKNELKSIYSNLIDIGGHTKNHTYLTSIPLESVFDEVVENKLYLEDCLGKSVTKFCFPGGKFNSDILNIIQNQFETFRTAHTMNSNFTGFLRTPTFHFYPRGKKSALLNLIRQKDNLLKIVIPGLMKINNDFDLIKYCIDKSNYANQDYKLHIFGHSWELEECNLWNKLEDLFIFLTTNYRNSIISY